MLSGSMHLQIHVNVYLCNLVQFKYNTYTKETITLPVTSYNHLVVIYPRPCLHVQVQCIYVKKYYWSIWCFYIHVPWSLKSEKGFVGLSGFLYFRIIIYVYMHGSRGGVPWNLQSLISPILLEMIKFVIFHICALPQLYVKVGPPLEKFSGSAPDWAVVIF